MSHTLGSPHPPDLEQAQLSDFMDYCGAQCAMRFSNCTEFEHWAIRDFRVFWRCFLDWARIDWSGSQEAVCVGDSCETAIFFPDLKINYAQVVLAQGEANTPAITAVCYGRTDEKITRLELRRRVLRLAAHYESMQLGSGDRIVAIARNRPEAVVAALAAAAIGASFSSCSPDMGTEAMLSRFENLGANALVAHIDAEPWDVGVPLCDKVREVVKRLPSIRHVIALDSAALPNIGVPIASYGNILEGADTTSFASRISQFAFNHPLFIMFSSGTTGPPKCIVHGAGGTLLEHLKEHRLHCDLKPGDRLYFHTSCAWMMWNWQLTALASGAEIVLYDGPIEGPHTLWELVGRLGVTVFGTSPTYLTLCERMGYRPRETCDLYGLRSILSTGSVLQDRLFDWVEREVKAVPLQSISGGTDIIGCFVLGHPLRPVRRGEAQSRSLALDVQALAADEAGIGELVCANPFPSRPLGFLGDDGSAFHASYFQQNGPYWTHGDLIQITTAGGARLHGRSDDVINIRGIRIGPAEIYSILKDIDWIADAMAVEDRQANGESDLLLLVVLAEGRELTSAAVSTIRRALRQKGSAALVPGRCVQVGELPETFSGKKSEAAVRDLLRGSGARNAASLRNPRSLDQIAEALVAPIARPIAASEESQPVAAPSVDSIRTLIAAETGYAIGADDNFFEAGIDSLAFVKILLSIEKLIGRPVPMDELFASSSPRRLADRLSAAGQAPERTSGPYLAVRPAQGVDLERVCALLDRGFDNRKISFADWRTLLNTQWTHADVSYGHVLTADSEIVGFVGTLFSDSHDPNGVVTRVCNLTSWYVDPRYRGLGSLLMAAAVRIDNVTFTSLTPMAVTEDVLSKLGFEAYARLAYFTPPLTPRWLSKTGTYIDFDNRRIAAILPERQLRLFQAHQLPGILHATISDNEGRSYLIVKRRIMKWRGFNLPVSEVLYASDYSVILRNLGVMIARCAIKQRTVLFSMEDRFMASGGKKPIRITKHRRYVKNGSPSVGRELSLFSELALLDI